MITTLALAQVDADKSKARAQVQKAIFAACKRMGIDDDARHEINVHVTGKPSIKLMTLSELRQVLVHLNSRQSRTPLTKTQRLIVSLWNQLADCGRVQHRNFAALESYCRARTGVHKLVWLTAEQETAMIEQLKQWLKRPGDSAAPRVTP